MPPPPPPPAPLAKLAQPLEQAIAFSAKGKNSEHLLATKSQVLQRSMSLLYYNLYIAEFSPAFIVH